MTHSLTITAMATVMSLMATPQPQCSITVLEPLSLVELSEEEIALEMEQDAKEMVALMVCAEAGNQDLDGMRLVADVILNRVDSDKFPDQNTVEDVLFAEGQFGPISDGRYWEMGWVIDDYPDVYKAVEMEWDREDRLDQNVLYFNTTWDNGKNPFQHGDHWFSY